MRRLLVLVLFAGCYKTPSPPCTFLCGEGGACPDGYQCSNDDNRCHLVLSGGGLAECTNTPAVPDANVSRIDASLIDAAIDAEIPDATPLDAPPPDAFAVCGVALAPADDGTSAARQALVLAEINPGDYIELFNNTASDIDLGTSATQLVSGTNVVAMSTAGAGVTVVAGGRATIPWPAALVDPADAGGELVLYLQSPPTAAEIMDFVCWGATPTTSLKADAEANGKWTAAGACPAALAAAAIHRLPATDGLDAADYDVTASPSPQNCGP